VCYFATDVHNGTLGEGKKDDSLARAGDIKGELAMVNNISRDCNEICGLSTNDTIDIRKE
jgi:hypothetical protein